MPHNDYIQDYLMHYGILGQKWGVRRYQPYSEIDPRKGEKTGKEIGQARISRRSAQKILNSIDKKKTIVWEKYRRSEVKESRLASRLDRLKSTGNERKINKVQQKYDEREKITNDFGSTLNNYESETNKILSSLKSSGKFNVSIKNVRRSTLTTGNKVAIALLTHPVLAGVFIAMSKTPGTKYKVTKHK